MRKSCAARITPTTAFVVTQRTRTTPTLRHRAMEAIAVLVREVPRGAVSRHEAPPGLQRMQRHASESRITTSRINTNTNTNTKYNVRTPPKCKARGAVFEPILERSILWIVAYVDALMRVRANCVPRMWSRAGAHSHSTRIHASCGNHHVT